MINTVLAAATTISLADSTPYSFRPALREGGLISQTVFSILVLMSIISFYILFSKLLDQQTMINEAKLARQGFRASESLRWVGATVLSKDSPYKQLVNDCLNAKDQHGRLTEPVKFHVWLRGSLARSEAMINSKLGDGLAFLATVGATAPFIGLFGTVTGIYRALIKVGGTHRASIEAVAGPVGEALIMTALGLVVAVPAVAAYNWLQRRNKSIAEDLNNFSNDVLGYIMLTCATASPVTVEPGRVVVAGDR